MTLLAPAPLDHDLDLAWVDVCAADRLLPDRGACALIDGEQVAVFLLSGGDVRAIGNRDPWSGANVLSRGVVGSIGERVVVASPMYKQHVDLVTGEGVEHPEVQVPVFPARIRDGRIEVARR